MISLSDRLEKIGNEVNKGETMVDLGTDHGFLPVALWERGISPKVIMADVSEGSLNKAKENCRLSHPDVEFDFRLGDGLKVIENGEVDAVVIAGMGGILMTEILEADLEKSWSFKKLILQPRNNVGFLRHWLYNNCYKITNEQLVREGKYICEIITAVPIETGVPKMMTSDRIEFEVPLKLLDFKNELTEEYIERKLNKEKSILQGIEKGNNPEFEVLRSQQYKIDYLTYLLKKCKENR